MSGLPTNDDGSPWAYTLGRMTGPSACTGGDD